VTNTVNSAVDTVDGATNGALTQTGVGGTVKGAAGAVAGPGTPVGNAVNGVTGGH